MPLQRTHCAILIFERKQLFNHHRRRAHRRRDEDIGPVGQREWVGQFYGAELGQRLTAEQGAEIGVAPAAGAEESRADGEVFDIVERDRINHGPCPRFQDCRPRGR